MISEDPAMAQAHPVPEGLEEIPHWIDGSNFEQPDGQELLVIDPAEGRPASRIRSATDATVDFALASAEGAMGDWSNASLSRRAEVLFNYRDVLIENRDRLCEAISREHGKPLNDAQGEVDRGLEVVEFACGAPHLLKGESSPNVSSGIDLSSVRQPLGVVVGITPFNFPAMVPLWMAPIAIAAGNAFILKPSEKTPSAAVLLARLASEADVPDGLFSVVHGDGKTAQSLLVDRRVAAVSSVGSTRAAKVIYETAAAHGKRVQALGGAKNHAVVLPDADLDIAADGLVGAAFGSTGQRCMAVAAVVAVGDIGDSLVESLAERADQLTVGAWTEPEADLGPVISEAQLQRVKRLIGEGVESGADLVVDGRGEAVAEHKTGYFLAPCVFDRVEPQMSIYEEEIFGPVLAVLRVETLGEAIAIVNHNPYGNGASIYTQDGTAARLFAQQVEAGMVGINVPIPVPMSYYSFGGWKDSLFGSQNIYGADGFRFYTRTKTITSRWQDHSSSGVDVNFPHR